jgi:hypothetical protein
MLVFEHSTMDDHIAMLLSVMISMEETYINDVLDNLDLVWSMIADSIELIIEFYNNENHLPEQANDISIVLNENMDYINSAIISP